MLALMNKRAQRFPTIVQGMIIESEVIRTGEIIDSEIKMMKEVIIETGLPIICQIVISSAIQVSFKREIRLSIEVMDTDQIMIVIKEIITILGIIQEANLSKRFSPTEVDITEMITVTDIMMAGSIKAVDKIEVDILDQIFSVPLQ